MNVFCDKFQGVHVHDVGNFSAFTAWKKTTTSYSAGQTVVFEGVIIDQGGHYDESNGEYDCAVDGVYYVSLNLKRYSNGNVALDVLRGSFVFLRLYDTYTYNRDGHYSNSAMIRCFPGEKIKVQGYTSGYILGDVAVPYSTLSVMLMHTY